MSTHSRNWLKFFAAIAFTLLLSVCFARLFNLPAVGEAQDAKVSRAALVSVPAPKLSATSINTLTELSDAYAAVTAAVRPSVVFIEADEPVTDEMMAARYGFQIPGLGNGGGGGRRGQQQTPAPATPRPTEMARSIGSGFIVSADGYILTNNHVIEGATNIDVRLLNDRVYKATLIGADKSTDIAVLKIDAKGLVPAALGSSEKVRVGEWVLAIGNPLGEDLTFSVTQGIVSAKGRSMPRDGDTSMVARLTIGDFIQTDAAINQGNSGGPLLNVRGEVIGINSAIASTTGSYQGYAFAIPIDLAAQVMNQIITHGKFERSVLGISVLNADRDDADYLDLPTIGGIVVGGFSGDTSPAKQAGIQIGDVIVAVDGKPVTYTAQLQQIVGFHKAGDVLKVEIVRKSGHKELNVKTISSAAPPEMSKPVTPSRLDSMKAPVAKNKLGLFVEPMTPTIAATIPGGGVPANTPGLYVVDIVANAPAAQKLNSRALNRVGSIILTVEGKKVSNEDDLRSALTSARNGVVEITVVNDNKGTPSQPIHVRLLP